LFIYLNARASSSFSFGHVPLEWKSELVPAWSVSVDLETDHLSEEFNVLDFLFLQSQVGVEGGVVESAQEGNGHSLGGGGVDDVVNVFARTFIIT